MTERLVALPPRRERHHADNPPLLSSDGFLLSSDGFFDPEATKILTAAFDTAWQMLKTSGSAQAADYRAASTRELLAKRIIQSARLGERNPIRLVDDALAHLANSN